MSNAQMNMPEYRSAMIVSDSPVIDKMASVIIGNPIEMVVKERELIVFFEEAVEYPHRNKN